jgi:hypothetical protein
MPITDRMDVLGQKVADILILSMDTTGLQLVLYGDDDRSPVTPCAVIETGSKHRDLEGIPRRVLNTMTVYIMLYLERIQDAQLNRKQAETLAEDVETQLHADAQLGGLVIHSFVTDVEYGYATRNGINVSAARMTFVAVSKTSLP